MLRKAALSGGYDLLLPLGECKDVLGSEEMPKFASRFAFQTKKIEVNNLSGNIRRILS